MMMNADKLVDENEALKAENEALKAKNKDLEIQCQELNDSLEAAEKMEQLLRRVGGKLKAQLAEKTEELVATIKIAGRHHIPRDLPTDGDFEKKVITALRAVPKELLPFSGSVHVDHPNPTEASSDEETEETKEVPSAKKRLKLT